METKLFRKVAVEYFTCMTWADAAFPAFQCTSGPMYQATLSPADVLLMCLIAEAVIGSDINC